MVRKLIAAFSPNRLALEKLFFSKNVGTALGVSEARGVVLLVAAEAHISIEEYTPNEVKIAVTGYGRADKLQVAHLIQRLLKLPSPITSDDAADALAIALCAAQTKPTRS